MSFNGQIRSSWGHEVRNTGQGSRLATNADVEQRTVAGQNLSSSGQISAPKSPQSFPLDLARVIATWPSLSVEKRDEILRLLG